MRVQLALWLFVHFAVFLNAFLKSVIVEVLIYIAKCRR